MYSDSCLHHNNEGQKNSDLVVRLKLPHTILHTKHKVEQGLTTTVALKLFRSSLNRENSESRFIKTKMHYIYTYRRVRSDKRAQT